MIWSRCAGPGSKSMVFAPSPKGGGAGNHVPRPSLQSCCMDRKECRAQAEASCSRGINCQAVPEPRCQRRPHASARPSEGTVMTPRGVLGSIMSCCSRSTQLSVVAELVLLLWFSAWQPPGAGLLALNSGSQQLSANPWAQPPQHLSPRQAGRLLSLLLLSLLQDPGRAQLEWGQRRC